MTEFNRGQINRYMEQVYYRENDKIYIMMLDIDRFKQINDTYGHVEGDRALIFVADTLKQVCVRMKTSAFLGRYGGDEFTIILQNPEENEGPEQVAETIRRMLSEERTENQLPYKLEVSIGFDALRDKNDSMQECMIRADENLYQEKKKKGTGRR